MASPTTARRSPKVEKLAEIIAEGSNDPSYKAMLIRAGYSRVVAEKNQERVLTSASLAEALADRGITGDAIAGALKGALNANLTSTFRGEVKESDVADHKTRLSAVERIAKMTGLDKRISESRRVNVTIKDDSLKKMLGL